MANHSYVTTSRNLTAAIITPLAQELLARYFGPVAVLRSDGDQWQVTFTDARAHGFSFWLATRRKIEFRHPLGTFYHWAQQVLIEEFAARLDGRIYHDGIQGPSQPDLAGINTYKKWLDALAKLAGPDKKLRETLYRIHLSELSEPLRSIPALGRLSKPRLSKPKKTGTKKTRQRT